MPSRPEAVIAGTRHALRTYDWTRRIPALGLVGFIVVLALQIPYPLLADDAQRFVTMWAVVAMFLTSTIHAWWSRGTHGVVALIVVCVGGGVVAEAVGSRTGVPFGNYRYTSALGWQLVGVPIVVPLAWAMFGWLALLCAQRVGGGWRGSVVGSLVLVAWDLFLDPQMVRAGGWVWSDTAGPWLNGIPLLNSVGWFVVGLAMMAALLRLVPPLRSGRADDLAWAMLSWTLFSETLLFAVFFRRPAVALAGTPALGTVLWFVWRANRRAMAR